MSELATRERLSPEQIELIKRQVAVGASNDELALFVQICNRTGLDPFARQIYAIKRRQRDADGKWREVMSFQISIDGARLIAERSGRYRPGSYYWAGQDGIWHESWMSDKAPKAAKAVIYKDDQPYEGIAHFSEYAQRTKDGALVTMWASMPRLMIAKCAEMLALRRGFPQELSGLYSPEELGTDYPPREIGTGRAIAPAPLEEDHSWVDQSDFVAPEPKD